MLKLEAILSPKLKGHRGTARMNCRRRVGNGILCAALILASVVGLSPGSTGAVDRPQSGAEPFVDTSGELGNRARASSVVGRPEVARAVRFDRNPMRALLADAPMRRWVRSVAGRSR
jgi:hypothetical protein